MNSIPSISKKDDILLHIISIVSRRKIATFNKMNRSKNFSREKPENSAMQTVNILGRLRMATEQVRKIQLNLARDGE